MFCLKLRVTAYCPGTPGFVFSASLSARRRRTTKTVAHRQAHTYSQPHLKPVSWPRQAVDDIETKKVGTYDDRILSMVDDLMLEALPERIRAWRDYCDDYCHYYHDYS